MKTAGVAALRTGVCSQVGTVITGPSLVSFPATLRKIAPEIFLPAGSLKLGAMPSMGLNGLTGMTGTRYHSDFIHIAPRVAPSLAPIRISEEELHSRASFFWSRKALAAPMSLTK